MPSVTASQSLSRPSHTSVLGMVAPWHTRWSPELGVPPVSTFWLFELRHAVVPGLHTPMLRPHGSPVSIRLLSRTPLQSLSLPSQVSDCWLQVAHTLFSSTTPLQLLALPSHTSVDEAPGCSKVQVCEPSSTQQAVRLLLVGSHFLTPVFLHSPSPTVHAAPLSKPSS